MKSTIPNSRTCRLEATWIGESTRPCFVSSAAHLCGVSETSEHGTITDGGRLPRRRTGILDPGLPRLSQQDEVRLVRRIEAGLAARAALDGEQVGVGASRAELERVEADGRQARDQFLLANLPLVWSVTGLEARRCRLPEEDLFQEGVLAMSRALQTFDPERGRFSTHALPRIKAQVVAVAASLDGALGIPASRAVEARRAKAIQTRLEAETGGPVTADQVAPLLGRNVRATTELLAHQPPVLGDDMLYKHQAAVAEESADQVADSRMLSGAHRRVLSLRFGLDDGQPSAYQQVAAELGTSASSVRRTAETALATLRAQQTESVQVRRTRLSHLPQVRL